MKDLMCKVVLRYGAEGCNVYLITTTYWAMGLYTERHHQFIVACACEEDAIEVASILNRRF